MRKAMGARVDLAGVREMCGVWNWGRCVLRNTAPDLVWRLRSNL